MYTIVGMLASIVGISADPFLLIPAILVGIFAKMHIVRIAVPAILGVLLTVVMQQELLWAVFRCIGGLIIVYITYGITKVIKK